MFPQLIVTYWSLWQTDDSSSAYRIVRFIVIPIRPGLLMPDPKSRQHLVLNSTWTKAATPLKIQHLPATYSSHISKAARVIACDGHIAGLWAPGDPLDAPTSSGVKIGCTLVDGTPLTWAWNDQAHNYMVTREQSHCSILTEAPFNHIRHSSIWPAPR